MPAPLGAAAGDGRDSRTVLSSARASRSSRSPARTGSRISTRRRRRRSRTRARARRPRRSCSTRTATRSRCSTCSCCPTACGSSRPGPDVTDVVMRIIAGRTFLADARFRVTDHMVARAAVDADARTPCLVGDAVVPEPGTVRSTPSGDMVIAADAHGALTVADRPPRSRARRRLRDAGAIDATRRSRRVAGASRPAGRCGARGRAAAPAGGARPAADARAPREGLLPGSGGGRAHVDARPSAPTSRDGGARALAFVPGATTAESASHRHRLPTGRGRSLDHPARLGSTHALAHRSRPRRHHDAHRRHP
jgi:hypothetical protein